MKSVGIITFHASHNYGSMLQAYALQQTVKNLGFDCRIINLRTSHQRQFYRPFYRQSSWLKKIKALRYPLLALADWQKHRLFERFLEERLCMTETEYTSSEELRKNPPVFDYYISGSDQIWNTVCFDFSESYFLDFVKSGKRIAYAPSMGPVVEQAHKKYSQLISESLKLYDAVSVREPGTARRIEQICGKDVEITADPTLLLSAGDWDDIAGTRPLVKGDYILLYDPWPEHNEFKTYEQSLLIAKKKGFKIVCTMPEAYHRWKRYHEFIFFTAAGPAEFINLVKFSKVVVGASFHAVVFSLIYGKPFYALRGMADYRISNLLKMTGLDLCAECFEGRSTLDFDQIRSRLRPYIEFSRRFLTANLK